MKNKFKDWSTKKKVLAVAIPLLLLMMFFSCSDKTADPSETTTENILTTLSEEIFDSLSSEAAELTETQTEESTTAATTMEEEATTEKATAAKPTTTKEPTTKKATTAKRTTTEEDIQANVDGASYIINKDTSKFHYPYCYSVDRMAEKNKKAYYGSRDDLIAQGYSPCKNCNP